ncbi:MAG TPA: ATP F0F1 synthase subunit B [Caulobacteraceae bacterium]|nr:ATP F0F1 synthase subunit B [Caulobacteraceae bacterium]
MHWLVELIQEAEFWVGVAFVIFVGLLVYLKVPTALAGVLDQRDRKIQAQLDEATHLREEAQALLASIKVQREEAEKLAAAMLENARVEATRLQDEAKSRLEETIARRATLAERKIAVAEAQAAAEVKAAAVDLAAQAAEAVLAARLAGATTDPLIDEGLSKLGDRFQ